MKVRFADAASADDVLAAAVAWYAACDVPCAFRSLNPMLLDYVRALGVDWRCVTTDGEDVIVHNRPVWQPEAD